MDITYLGNSTFKLKTKSAVAAIDDKSISITRDNSESKKIIDGPGEYEIAGISVYGYKSAENTVFLIEVEGIKIVCFGDAQQVPNTNILDEISDVDALLISTIEKPNEIISKIEPYFVILKSENNSAQIESFIKESGMTAETLSKFTLKKEDILEDQNTKIIVLEKK